MNYKTTHAPTMAEQPAMSLSSSSKSDTIPATSPSHSENSWIEENCTSTEETWTEETCTTPPTTTPQVIEPPHTVVNTTEDLRTCLDVLVRHINIPPKLYSKAHCLPKASKTINVSSSLSNVPQSDPELYVDAEGIRLSREGMHSPKKSSSYSNIANKSTPGELSILILHVETQTFSHTYLIHVHVLGRRTFYLKNSSGIHSLKTIFEDDRIAKELFDCRMDSDALFGQFTVLLSDVMDLQLMYLAVDGHHQVGLFGAPSTLFRMFLELLLPEHVLYLDAYPRAEKLTANSTTGSLSTRIGSMLP